MEYILPGNGQMVEKIDHQSKLKIKPNDDNNRWWSEEVKKMFQNDFFWVLNNACLLFLKNFF